jgi:hypothetical protein
MSVVDEVKKIEGEIVGTEKKVEAVVEAAVIDVKAEEKLVISRIVSDYLKAQLRLQAATTESNDLRTKFETEVKNLITKYAVDPAKYIFNEAELVFKKIEQKV